MQTNALLRRKSKMMSLVHLSDLSTYNPLIHIFYQVFLKIVSSCYNIIQSFPMNQEESNKKYIRDHISDQEQG